MQLSLEMTIRLMSTHVFCDFLSQNILLSLFHHHISCGSHNILCFHIHLKPNLQKPLLALTMILKRNSRPAVAKPNSEESLLVFEMVEIKLEIANEMSELDTMKHVAGQIQKSIYQLSSEIRVLRRETQGMHRQMMDKTGDLLSEIQDYHETLEIFSHETDWIDEQSAILEHRILLTSKSQLNDQYDTDIQFTRSLPDLLEGIDSEEDQESPQHQKDFISQRRSSC